MPKGTIEIRYEYNEEDKSDLGHQTTSNLSNKDLIEILTHIVSTLDDIDE